MNCGVLDVESGVGLVVCDFACCVVLRSFDGTEVVVGVVVGVRVAGPVVPVFLPSTAGLFPLSLIMAKLSGI